MKFAEMDSFRAKEDLWRQRMIRGGRGCLRSLAILVTGLFGMRYLAPLRLENPTVVYGCQLTVALGGLLLILCGIWTFGSYLEWQLASKKTPDDPTKVLG
jgi:hypothetical protein